MTPQNIEFTYPQGEHSPDYLPSNNSVPDNFADKRFNKPDIQPDPVSNEVMLMRNLGAKISSLRQASIQVETERAHNRRSSIAASISNVVNKLLGMPSSQETTPNIKRDILMERESLIGGQMIFGSVERGVTRRFFYDDTAQHQAWFFTETAQSSDGSLRYINEMRYEIHDNGILEVARINDQSPQGYHYAWQYIDNQEFAKLQHAAEAYSDLIVDKIYSPDYGLAA